jgi:membrane associated rhomboid family serine protease
VLKVMFKRPYRPVAQTVYYAVAGILGGVLLIVGQPWGIGLAVLGCSGIIFSGLGAAWRRRNPN